MARRCRDATEPERNAVSMPPLEHILWMKHGDLLLPAAARGAPHESIEGCRVYVTHEEAYGRPISWDEFLGEIDRFPSEAVAVYASKLNALLFWRSISDRRFQKGLARELLPAPASENVMRLLDEPDRVAFFEEQLLGLAKWSLLRGQKGGDLGLPGHGKEMIRLVFAVSELMHLDYAESGNDERDLTRLAVRSLFFNSTEAPVRLLTRYYDLWLLRPNSEANRASPNHVDIPAAFRRATGLGLEDYLAGGFAFLAHFMRFREAREFGRTKYQVSWDELRVELGQPGVSDNLLRQVSWSIEEFRAAFEPMPTEPRVMGASLLPFWKHPVLRLSSGEMVPLSQRLLFERLSSGVFWIVHDYLKKAEGDDARAKFTRFVGELFQQQVHEILRDMIGDSPHVSKRLFDDFEYGEPRVRGSDATVVYQDAVIFVEASVARLRYVPTVLEADLDSLAEDVDKCVLAKARQLDRVVRDFRAGKFSLGNVNPRVVPVIPVLVLIEPFPHFVLTIRDIERRLQERGYLQDTERLHILDAEELLMLNALVAGGHSLRDILRNKAADPTYARAAMKNYLNATFSGTTSQGGIASRWYEALSSLIRSRLTLASEHADGGTPQGAVT
jgi:hypothetical protein